MFKFFGGSKDKSEKTPPPVEVTPVDAGAVENGTAPRVYEKGQVLTDAEKKDLRAQAMANAKLARDAIGNEALQKIKAAMVARESSPMVQAKKILETMETNRLNDELLAMIRDRQKPH